MAGAVDLKSVRKEAFRVASAGILSFRWMMLDLRSMCGRGDTLVWQQRQFPTVISCGNCRTSYASADLLGGTRNTFGTSASKLVERLGILTPSMALTC